MQILFIGGTGLISTASAAATVAAGHDLWLMNRGLSKLPSAVPPSGRCEPTPPMNSR